MLDLLIVGSGPTGLMAAIEAARHGLNFRIINHPQPSEDRTRAAAIQARTLEIFDYLGIADAFLAEGNPVKAANPISRSRRLARIPFSSLPSPYPFILTIQQEKTERILTHHLQSLGVKIENAEFLKLTQNPQDVEVVLQGETLKASWVLGCDGAHSSVRKALHLPFAGKAFPDVLSLADATIDWHYPHDEFCLFLDAIGIFAAIPLPETNRYRIVFQLPRCKGLGELASKAIPKPTLAEIEQLLKKHAGSNTRITNLAWTANFYINSRIVSQYRKERVFLAGDAAHIHSPVGGQGMNTGIQDVFNLIWKLSHVKKEKALPSLLDTYDLERYSVGKRLLATTYFFSKIAFLDRPFAIFLRNILLSFIASLPFVQKQIVKAISQTAIRYPQSQIVGKGIATGLRAPNASLSIDDQPTTLYALWRKSPSFHRLLFGHSQLPLDTHDVLINHKTDPTGAIRKFYGRKENKKIVTIRPDLIICSELSSL